METELQAAEPERPKSLLRGGEGKGTKGWKQRCAVAVEPTSGGRCWKEQTLLLYLEREGRKKQGKKGKKQATVQSSSSGKIPEHITAFLQEPPGAG